ncbi:hypothetical protein VNO77_34365 [Canavalia gladiata]|uniref:Uncharacterized protein n=1 Tax=Canavalia gladiata TaxID=3824 RepID=A0AAN9KG49_CANGL
MKSLSKSVRITNPLNERTKGALWDLWPTIKKPLLRGTSRLRVVDTSHSPGEKKGKRSSPRQGLTACHLHIRRSKIIRPHWALMRGRQAATKGSYKIYWASLMPLSSGPLQLIRLV